MRRLTITTFLILMIGVLACTDKTDKAMDLTEQGWESFEDGELDEARSDFEDAIDQDSTYADAHNGLGWCDLLEDKLASALDNFEKALFYDSELIDASAGASLAATDKDEHQKAVDYAKDVIDADASYKFSHYPSVTIEDIRLARAKSAATLGYFDTVLEEIKEFDSSFDEDPNTSEGQAAILAKLEELISQYGG